MKIALFSDIHDQETNMLHALVLAKQLACEALLFMGDMESLSTFQNLRDTWEGPLDLVFGNNEYQRADFIRVAHAWPQTKLHGVEAKLTLSGRRIYFTHFPWDAQTASRSGHYDAVFYGHTHQAEQHLCGECLVVNPGEIMGRQSTPSFAVYDTESNRAQHYPLA